MLLKTLIDDEYFEYKLTLSLQGSFKNMMAFLAYVESYARFLRIQSFSFSPRVSRFQTDLSVGLVLIGYGMQK